MKYISWLNYKKKYITHIIRKYMVLHVLWLHYMRHKSFSLLFRFIFQQSSNSIIEIPLLQISKKRRRIVASTSDSICLSCPTLLTFTMAVKSRWLIHFTHFYIGSIYYWTCSRPEYSWNTAHLTLCNDQSIIGII